MMKKIGFVLVLTLILVVLCICGGYVKSYSATILITSCQGDEASMEFNTFKGTYNFKLKRSKKEKEKSKYQNHINWQQKGDQRHKLPTEKEKSIAQPLRKHYHLDQKHH